MRSECLCFSRSFGVLARASLTAFAALVLACGPAPAPDTGAEAKPANLLVVDTLEIGLGFDEAVTIQGAARAARTTTTEVTLLQTSEDGDFTGRVEAVDAAGNVTDLNVEVRIGAGSAGS